MPAAIPLVVMAAGAVAQKVAADKQKKKQAEADKAAMDTKNKPLTGIGDALTGRATEQKGINDQLLGNITGGLQTQWNAANQDQPSFNPYMSSSMPFYQNAMKTGLFDEGQKNDFRARGAIQNDKLFEGFSRQLGQAANVHGGGFAGYSGQNALLQRDKGRQAEENRLNTEGTLQGQIRGNQFAGASGVTGNDRDFQSGQLASANLQGQGLDRQFSQRSGVLGNLQNLRTQTPNDLNYSQGAIGAYNGVQPVSNYVGTPWYGTVGTGAQAAASAYMGGGAGAAGGLANAYGNQGKYSMGA